MSGNVWPNHDSGPVEFVVGSLVFLPPQKSSTSAKADMASSLNIVNIFKFHLVSRPLHL